MTRQSDFHRLRFWTSLRLFAFVPWTVFAQSGVSLPDHSRMRFGFSQKPECRSIELTTVAEVVNSPESMTKGLSDRRIPLKPNESMAFIYKESRTLQFWMLRTYFPLQIAFFDDQGRLIEAYEMLLEPDPSHPKKIYSSSHPSILALEMRSKTLRNLPPQSRTFLCVDRM